MVAEAADGIQVLSIIRAQSLDVVILDISIPGRNGLEVLKIITRESPNLSVLMLSIYSESQFALRALKAGAAGYLTKESAPGQLVAAIRKAASRGKYIRPPLAEKMVAGLLTDTSQSLHESLSDREFEILRALAAGKTISQIAGQLNLSVKNVSTYRSRLLDKMKMENNAELMNYAIKHGLVFE